MVISVIVPTRNRAQQLKRVLDALIAEEYVHKEIVVCDGASTDDTVELLRSYGNQVRWVSKPDCGEYEARNTGLKMATGDIIKYMSDDDVPLPGSFSYAVNFFRNHPDVDILFGQSIWFDERDGEIIVADTRKRTESSITLRNFIRNSAPLPNSETVFFRSRIIDKIGLFDTSKHGGDYDYWARAAKAGLQLRVCDKVLVHYHLSRLSGVERKNLRLLFETWKRAWLYGTWSDRAYVTFCLVPLRVTIRAVSSVPGIGKPLRRQWGKWKSRQPFV